MPAPLMVGMTPDVTVEGAYIIRVTALNASTGNVVAGVNVTSAAIIATDISESDATEPVVNIDPAYLPG